MRLKWDKYTKQTFYYQLEIKCVHDYTLHVHANLLLAIEPCGASGEVIDPAPYITSEIKDFVRMLSLSLYCL